MHKTYITGKDFALEDTLTGIISGLAAAGISLEITQERNPVDHVWSVHLRHPASGLYTNGKGSSELAAKVSAYAEFCERYASGYFFAPLFIGPRTDDDPVFSRDERCVATTAEMLTPALWALYDSDGTFRKQCKRLPGHLALLMDAHVGTGIPTEAPRIRCLPFTRLDAPAETALFPLNLLWNLYASNGLSAGNTPLEARIQGLSEIMERHVRYRVVAEGLCLPEVPETAWTDLARGVRTGVEAAGFRLTIRDASLGGRYPVIAVGLVHAASGEALTSFGAHPDFRVALDRTLTELFQGRALALSDEFSAPSADLEPCADPGNLESHFINSTGLVPARFFAQEPDFAWRAWPKAATREEELECLLATLKADGKHAWFRETAWCGLTVCHILVPGFSEVYPLSDLFEQNTSRFQVLRTFLSQGPAIDDDVLAECLELFERELAGSSSSASISDLVGIDFTGSPWEGLGADELGALLLLAAGDSERLAETLSYGFNWQTVPPQRRGFWRLLGARLEESDLPVEALYTAETIAEVELALAGDWPMNMFPPLGADWAALPAHQGLVALFGSHVLI